MDAKGLQSAERFLPARSETSPDFVAIIGRRWERRAVQVGTIAGRAVAIVGRVRRRWYQFDPRQAAGEAAETLRRETAARSEEWREAAKRRGEELRDRAKARYERGRAKAEQLGQDHPAHVVLAAAAAGFVLGAGLRVWRSIRAA
jgi:ElaB/YqjD/DUF883 family membrane-anchored ribosome-binding protein